MPARPPLHRAQGWRPKQPWQRSIGQQGREHALPKGWTKIRAQVLREEPLCRQCRAAGRASVSTEVDHIVPRSKGGASVRANLAGICGPCHRAKTQAESLAARTMP